MRILLLAKFPPIVGGVSRLVLQTVLALAERGIKVDLLTHGHSIMASYRQLFTEEDHDYLAELTGTSDLISLHRTGDPTIEGAHFIPPEPATMSQLVGEGLVLSNSADAIVGWYFEPYGMAACLIGQISDKPVLLLHAGSDLGRLASHPKLRALYRWGLAQCSGIVTAEMPSVMRRLDELGAQTDKAFYVEGFTPLLTEFNSKSDNSCASLPSAYTAAFHSWAEEVFASEAPELLKSLHTNFGNQTSGPVVGIYGKIGLPKGSFDLVSALGKLADEGISFHFKVVCCGWPANLADFVRALLERPNLASRTTLLPPLPPWRIPAFIDGCDLMCFLERNFEIDFHTPVVPREILARERCLVISGDIANKGVWQQLIKHGKTAYVVDDPRDTLALASVLRRALLNPVERQDVAACGGRVSRSFEKYATQSPSLAGITRFLDGIREDKDA